MRISSGPASHCVRSPGNRARQGDSDRKAARREVRTSAMKRGVRAAGESSARLWDRPLCKRWRAHRSVSCDTKSDVPPDVPFLALGRTIEMMRAPQKPRMRCTRLQATAATWQSEKTHLLAPFVRARPPLAVFCQLTSSARRGTVPCRSACARKLRPLFRADMSQSWDARRLARRSSVCPPHWLVVPQPCLEYS